MFVRLSPAHKQRIIKALQSKRHVVGFMGDGINDAPALRAADVGISVDTAVDIAKEAADAILLEKSLMVLEEGVIEGRKVFANILKYIRMGASSNFGNMFSVLGASLWLPYLPMSPIKILTNNLLYDFSQVPIPTDEVDPEQVAKPRPWSMGEIARFILFIGPCSSVFDYTTYLHDVVRLQVQRTWGWCRRRNSPRVSPTRRRQSGFHLCGGIIPDRMVRRIAADSDADHPRHSNQQDPVHPEPRQLAADHDFGGDNASRDVAAVFADRAMAGHGSAALSVLALLVNDASVVCRADASG